MDGGGSERQMLQLLEGLDRGRYSPHLFLLYRTGPLLDMVPSDVAISDFWGDGPTTHSRLPGWDHRRQKIEFTRILNRTRGQIVYDRLFHMTMIAGGAIRRSPHRIAHVTTIVSPPSKDLPRCERRFLPIKRYLLAKAYRRATKVLAVSAATADDAAAYYHLDRGRIEILPSPIHVERIDKLAGELESLPAAWQAMTEPQSDRVQRIVSVGRLSSEKGHASLIEAMSILRSESAENQPHLFLLGDGPLKAELGEQVERLGLTERIHFCGHVSNPYSMIEQADLVVLPSRYEGFPNVLLESVCLATPILSTACSDSVISFLDELQLRPTVPVDAPASLAAAISERLKIAATGSESEAESLARAAAVVREQRSLASWLDQMQRVFHTSLESVNR
jgi:glycosyltransferase involved in cell wall biosynthesis